MTFILTKPIPENLQHHLRWLLRDQSILCWNCSSSKEHKIKTRNQRQHGDGASRDNQTYHRAFNSC